MKILFVIDDVLDYYNYLQHTDVTKNMKRRAVEIELTEEQVKKLRISNVSEEISSVSITYDEIKKQTVPSIDDI